MKTLNFLAKLLLTTVYSSSLLANPGQDLDPYDHCCPIEEECNHQYCFIDKIPLIGGVVVVAAAAALASRYKNDSSDGSTGRKGSPGGEFIPDQGQTLTFNFNELDLTLRRDDPVSNPASLLITPFVVAPDGTIVEGTPVPVLSTALTIPNISLGVIQIPNPLFGAYQPGVQITNVGDPLNLIQIGPSSAFEARLNVSVTASRDTSTTSTVERDVQFTPFVFETNEQVQVIADFTYSPGDIP